MHVHNIQSNCLSMKCKLDHVLAILKSRHIALYYLGCKKPKFAQNQHFAPSTILSFSFLFLSPFTPQRLGFLLLAPQTHLDFTVPGPFIF